MKNVCLFHKKKEMNSSEKKFSFSAFLFLFLYYACLFHFFTLSIGTQNVCVLARCSCQLKQGANAFNWVFISLQNKENINSMHIEYYAQQKIMQTKQSKFNFIHFDDANWKWQWVWRRERNRSRKKGRKETTQQKLQAHRVAQKRCKKNQNKNALKFTGC